MAMACYDSLGETVRRALDDVCHMASLTPRAWASKPGGHPGLDGALTKTDAIMGEF